jgi:hypothetical protein
LFDIKSDDKKIAMETKHEDELFLAIKDFRIQTKIL